MTPIVLLTLVFLLLAGAAALCLYARRVVAAIPVTAQGAQFDLPSASFPSFQSDASRDATDDLLRRAEEFLRTDPYQIALRQSAREKADRERAERKAAKEQQRLTKENAASSESATQPTAVTAAAPPAQQTPLPRAAYKRRKLAAPKPSQTSFCSASPAPPRDPQPIRQPIRQPIQQHSVMLWTFARLKAAALRSSALLVKSLSLAIAVPRIFSFFAPRLWRRPPSNPTGG
jgi:hypothetical protein